MFSLTWNEMPLTTAVPDAFISGSMKDAPGEYVKVLIFLMMLSHKKDVEASVENLSRIFSCSEKDIIDALLYWEKQQLLELFRRNGKITGIQIHMSVSEKPNESHRLGTARINSLVKEDEDARQLLFIAEQYFSRPLSAIESSTLLYFMDELHFSLDLCDYLIQYCIEKGHTSIRYMESVALSWHKKGYTTVKEASENSSNWSKIHFEVLKAFGIRNRNPIPKEVEYIDRWYKEYCFSPDIIAEACSITLNSTGKQSFQYADKILSTWHENGVKTKKDIERLNEEHKQSSQNTAKTSGMSSNNKNQFHNFEQRTDDLDELERKLDRQFAEAQLKEI